MVDQARTPFAADVGILATRDQARILHRDHGLVVVAIERPGLDLTLAALAAVQQMMERMQAMIATRADVAQAGLELVGREQFHSTILSPSSAISQPAASTLRRGPESDDQDRIGVVDMDVDAPRVKARQRGERPPCPVDRHVAHAAAGLGARSAVEHFLVGEQRAVEQHHIGLRQPFGQQRRHRGASRHESEPRVTGRHRDADIGPAFGRGVRAVAFEIERDLARHGEELREQATRQGDAFVDKGRAAGDHVGCQHLEDRIGGERRQRLRGRMHREGQSARAGSTGRRSGRPRPRSGSPRRSGCRASSPSDAAPAYWRSAPADRARH